MPSLLLGLPVSTAARLALLFCLTSHWFGYKSGFFSAYLDAPATVFLA